MIDSKRSLFFYCTNELITEDFFTSSKQRNCRCGYTMMDKIEIGSLGHFIFTHPKPLIDTFKGHKDLLDTMLIQSIFQKKLRAQQFLLTYFSPYFSDSCINFAFDITCSKACITKCHCQSSETAFDFWFKYHTIDHVGVKTLCENFSKSLSMRKYKIVHKVYPHIKKQIDHLGSSFQEEMANLIGYTYRFHHYKTTALLWKKYHHLLPKKPQTKGLGYLAEGLFKRSVIDNHEKIARAILHSSKPPSLEDFKFSYETCCNSLLKKRIGILRAMINHTLFTKLDVNSLLKHLERSSEKDLILLTELIINSQNSIKTKIQHIGLLLKIADKKGYLDLLKKIICSPLFAHLSAGYNIFCFNRLSKKDTISDPKKDIYPHLIS